MKYRNKITNEILEAKTYTEKYVYENNSNYEILIEEKKPNENKKTPKEKKPNENMKDEKSEDNEDKGQNN